jgi:hypothetical protein
MSFSAGYGAGVGKASGDMYRSMLDQQMKRAQGLADMYKAVAGSENFSPTVRKMAFDRMGAITSHNDPFSLPKITKKYSNFKDLFSAAEVEEQQAEIARKTATVPQEGWGSPIQGFRPPDTQYSGGMRNPEADAQLKSYQSLVGIGAKSDMAREKEEQKTEASQQAAQRLLDAHPGDDFVQDTFQLMDAWEATGRKGPPPILATSARTVAVTLTDESGKLRSYPSMQYRGVMYVNVSEDAKPLRKRVVPASYGRPAHVVDTYGRRLWVVPGEAPQPMGAGAPQMVSQTNSWEDPVNLERGSSSFRGYLGGPTPPPTAGPGGPRIGHPGTGGGRQQGSAFDTAQSYMEGVEGVDSTGVGYRSTPAEAKQKFSSVGVRKTGAAYGGVVHLAHIAELMGELQQSHGTTGTGPVLGRLSRFLNEVGWGGGLQRLMEWQRGAINPSMSPEQQEMALRQAEQQFDSLAGEALGHVQAWGVREGEQDAAQKVAQLITLMRSLNGLELVAMSGSGNGITRLYQMMHSALMNPTQDPSIVRGHGLAMGQQFAEIINNTYTQAGLNAWERTPGQYRNYLEFLGLDKYIGGNPKNKFSNRPGLNSPLPPTTPAVAPPRAYTKSGLMRVLEAMRSKGIPTSYEKLKADALAAGHTVDEDK